MSKLINNLPFTSIEGHLPFKNRKIQKNIEFFKVPNFDEILTRHSKEGEGKEIKEKEQQLKPIDYLSKVEKEIED